MNNYQFFAEKKTTPLAQYIAKILHRKLLIVFNRYVLGPEKRVLEIGPGLGRFSTLLSTISGIQFKGCEPQSFLAKNLQDQGFEIIQASVPPIPEKDSSFNAIVMLNVLEHMKGLTEAQHIAAELYRALAPNGIAFLTFPNYLDWNKDFFNLDYTHWFITTEVNTSQLFRDAGFSIEYVGRHYGCFFSDFGRFPNALVKFCRALLVTLLPRKIGRNERIQKMGVLFSENIILVARKVT